MVSDDVEQAARVIRSGGLVAMPTETVYGLAADATNADAVRRIFEVKGRPADHPLIVHLGEASWVADWTSDVTTSAGTLIDACWPGPLTVILPRAAGVLNAVTGGRDTVGLRVPAHPMALGLLDRVGVGLAAPSANRFGSVSPTSADHVLDDLRGRLDPRRDLVLDGGVCAVGVESTIVDCTVEPRQVLRAGGIAVEEVRRLLEDGLADVSGPSRASGMLASHYAPRCAVVLVDARAEGVALVSATPHAELLDFGDDLVRYAQQLYARLREADRRRVRVVVAVLPPARGLGHAIRDRLTKAAAPRP
jgi:L-threonylcarbamoyladenylate synthase